MMVFLILKKEAMVLLFAESAFEEAGEEMDKAVNVVS